MPLDFDGLKKQRFRWALGGIQILKFHWRELLPLARHRMRLTVAQRIHYLLGSVQWFAEVLTAVFTILLLATALATSLHQRLPVRQLTGAVLAIPLAFAATGVLRAMWAMRRACQSSYADSLSALRVWFALSWVVTLACLRGLVQKRADFLRTPKSKEGGSLLAALRASRTETLLTIAAILGGAAMLFRSPGLATVILGLLLFFEAFVYSNAPWASMAAEGIILTPERQAYARSPQNTGDRPAWRRRARGRCRSGLTALVAAAAVAALVVSSPSDRAPFSGPQQDLPRIGNVAPNFGVGPTPNPTPSVSATAERTVGRRRARAEPERRGDSRRPPPRDGNAAAHRHAAAHRDAATVAHAVAVTVTERSQPMPEVTEVEVGAVDPARFDSVLDSDADERARRGDRRRAPAVRGPHHLERQLHRQGRRRRRDAQHAAAVRARRRRRHPLAGDRRRRRVLPHHQAHPQPPPRRARRRRGPQRRRPRSLRGGAARPGRAAQAAVPQGRRGHPPRPADRGADPRPGRRRLLRGVALPRRPRHPQRGCARDLELPAALREARGAVHLLPARRSPGRASTRTGSSWWRRRSTRSPPRTSRWTPEAVHAILASTRASSTTATAHGGHVRARRRQPGRIEHRATVAEGSRLGAETPLVLQVSRWDRLKDPIGVLEGFVGGVVPGCDAHLMLAGPSVAEVADDPEGAETYEEVKRAFEALPEDVEVARPPGLPADGRRRGERGHGQRAPAPRRHRGAEEPCRGLRAHRRGGDVEGAAGGGQPHRRHPGPDRGRRQRDPARRSPRQGGLRRGGLRAAQRPRSAPGPWARRPRRGSRATSSARATSPSTWRSAPSSI